MSKKIFLLCLILILVGCVPQKKLDYLALKTKLNQMVLSNDSATRNHFKKYYSYYLEPALTLASSDDLTSIFNYDDYKIVLNVNLSNIISETHYPDKVRNPSLIDSKFLVFEYDEVANKDFTYNFRLYEDKGIYIIEMMNVDFTLFAIGPEVMVSQIADKMLLVLKHARINKEKIIDDYSSKEIIDHHRRIVDLFRSVLPANGRLDELIKP